MSHTATEVVSHAKRVLSLYKRCLRCIRDHYTNPADFLYHSSVLRRQFEANRNVTDFREATKLLQEGEHQLFNNMHPQPRKFFLSPGGIGYQRSFDLPDWLLDTWHPLEKAQYPEYFARREIRKKEYIENWEKKYGKTSEA